MSNDVIKSYLDDILKPTLKHYGTSKSFLEQISSNIGNQLYSAIFHWNNIKFRKALLLIGLEEGAFYEPAGNIDVRCLVVIAIRNSLFETLQSDNYKAAGLPRPLNDSQVKSFIGKSIEYFNKIDIVSLSQKLELGKFTDIYGDIVVRYPVSWAALQILGTNKAKCSRYASLVFDTPYELTELNYSVKNRDTDIIVEDGYNSAFSDQYLTALSNIVASDTSCFIISSFKSLTRNFEKLLKIMEFLLSHRKALVSANYYIRNGYVERRIPIVKAEHTTREIRQNLENTSGLGPMHRRALKEALKQFK